MVVQGKLGHPADSSRRYIGSLVAAWTIAVTLSLGFSGYQEYRATHELALGRARIALEKDVRYRRWIAQQGGVYVWVNERTQPSEHLRGLPDRDIGTPQGQLTLINPARVSRHVFETETESSGTRSHITSLLPIRPANAPDPWEREALEACERGASEVWTIANIRGAPYFRLLHPLLAEESCLRCHSKQGYSVGDVRGGISISVPMEPLRSLMLQHVVSNALGHGLLWALGLCGIGWGARRLRQQATRRRRAEDKLWENEIHLRTVTEHQARLEAEHLLSLTHQKLRLARQIQQRLLPSMPPVLPGVDVAAVLYSADDTSGDFYDYVTLRDGSLGIIIADVCGHGIGPALLAVETRAYLRALADASSDAGEILRGLNEFLCGDMAEGFVTLFFAQIDPRSRTLIFCGAGHVGYLFDSDGTCTQLAATNLPLGITSPMAIAACPPR
ncbi:MAG: DUF3365 domain-containing protein, partial [Pirellulaceae bacterium]|nr:DUF3365 domain-containing protein [Pirellulaceae bacterium]